MLSLPQLNDVCMLHGGSNQCRYLEMDNKAYGKWHCKKQSPDARHLDDLVDEHIRTCRIDGVDPNTTNIPIADNCNGYPFLKDILQGYDVE